MSQLRLLKTKRFYPIFWTQFLGAFNDNFLKNALVILITFKTASIMGVPSNQMVAVAGGIFILPFFIFSATAGQLADKYEKSRLVRIIKTVEIMIMLLATIGFMTEHFEFLLIVLFLMGLHSTFFGPIKFSILPQHLNTTELVGGNALVEAGTFLSVLLGTILGGVLIPLQNGGLIVSLSLIGVAVLGWFMSLKIPEAPAVDSKLKVQWNPIPPTLSIYRFTQKTRSVYLSILGISWFWSFGAGLLSLIPPYCKDVLKAGPNTITLFLAIFSIGIGIGSLLCARLSRKHLELGLVPFGSIGMSLFTADLFFANSSFGVSARILVDLLMLSVFSGLFIVPLYTLIQERSAVSHRSRIIAANNILNAFFMVLSALFILGMMRFEFSIPQIFLSLALINAAVALYIYTLLPEFFLRFFVWGIANIMYRLKVTGDHRIPKEGAAVLVCNHVTFIDWLIVSAGIKRPIRFIMDHNFAKGFFIRMLLKQAKVILIAPAKENPKLLRESFEKARDELRSGELVCIFPEGMITRDGKMNPFRPGVEKIITETPVAVIPMGLRGMWGSFFSREAQVVYGEKELFKHPKRFWSRVELRVGEPVSPSQATTEILFEKVSQLL